jgi:adenine phosphoribosyltransferase
MSDKLDLKKHIRNIEDFPIPGIKFRDITSLIEAPEPFRKTCKELTKITQDFSADFVVSIESRGFIFAGSVATDLPELGGSKLIIDQGYHIETIISY